MQHYAWQIISKFRYYFLSQVGALKTVPKSGVATRYIYLLFFPLSFLKFVSFLSRKQVVSSEFTKRFFRTSLLSEPMHVFIITFSTKGLSFLRSIP